MEQIEQNGWVIGFDRQNTQNIYNSVGKGATEDCTCNHCANFVIGRKYYPDVFLDLLNQLGIDCKKEFETWCIAPTGMKSLHFYHGGFNFIGSILKEPPPDLVKQIDSVSSEIQFSCSFSYHTDLAHDEFKELKKTGTSVASVDFSITIPWLLEIAEDDTSNF